VRHQLKIPFDTTLHYATAHLHPYGSSLALVDLTTGETLFELRAIPYADRLGIAEMESLSTTVGIPIYRHHDYELVTVYDNTSDEPVDAMASMYLYLLDNGFERLPDGDA
jgi:hypothetical protein